MLYINFISNIKSLINNESKQFNIDIKKLGKQIKLLFKLKKKLIFNGKGNNFILVRIEFEIINLKKVIIKNVRQIKIYKIASNIIKNFDFEPEQHPAVDKYSISTSSLFTNLNFINPYLK